MPEETENRNSHQPAIYQYEARGVLHTGQQATTYSVTLFSTSPEIANTERHRPS